MKSSKLLMSMSVRSLLIFGLLLVPQSAFGYSGEVPVEHSSTGDFIKFEGTYSKPAITPYAETTVKVLSGPTLESKNFVRYLTDSWAKAASYTWSKSNSVSSTVSTTVGLSAAGISSALGLSNTVTTTYSVAITIPADTSRYSKLAFHSDFHRRYVQLNTYDHNGWLYKTEYTNHYAPLKDTYLVVAYQ